MWFDLNRADRRSVLGYYIVNGKECRSCRVNTLRHDTNPYRECHYYTRFGSNVLNTHTHAHHYFCGPR